MGCAEYLVTIQPAPGRGNPACGGAFCSFDCSDEMAWSWGRIRNATSAATLVLPRADGCCSCVPRKWHDELAFWRLDPGTRKPRLKWIGPVETVIDNTVEGTLSILAQDRSAWILNERRVPQGINGLNEQAIIRFQRIWNLVDQMQATGLNLIRLGGLTGISIADSVDQWASVSAELQKLQGYGVSWTVVGDTVFFGDLSGKLTPTIIDPAIHWENGGAIVSDLGSTRITNLLLEATINGETVVILYPPSIIPDPCDGIHIQSLAPSFEFASEQQAYAFAIQEFKRRSSQGLSVATSVDSSISQDWPIPMCDMRSGGTVTVDTRGDAFCLGNQTEAQLADMTVEGVGCKETSIRLTLAPETGVSGSLV